MLIERPKATHKTVGAKYENVLILLYLMTSGGASELALRCPDTAPARLITLYNSYTREPFDRHLRYLPALHGINGHDETRK